MARRRANDGRTNRVTRGRTTVDCARRALDVFSLIKRSRVDILRVPATELVNSATEIYYYRLRIVNSAINAYDVVEVIITVISVRFSNVC